MTAYIAGLNRDFFKNKTDKNTSWALVKQQCKQENIRNNAFLMERSMKKYCKYFQEHTKTILYNILMLACLKVEQVTVQDNAR